MSNCPERQVARCKRKNTPRIPPYAPPPTVVRSASRQLYPHLTARAHTGCVPNGVASMRRAVWLVISTSLLPFVHPAAQQLGQRIRVLATDVTPGRWVVGDLLAQDGDSLRLQVRRGQTRAWLAGARLGFGLGVIAGAVRHVSREHSRECDGWFTNECD